MVLLAKSKDPKSNDPARTLQEHIDDCVIIFKCLKVSFPKAAELSGFGDDFWNILWTCIICHDLGKSHKEFQNVLAGLPNEWNYQTSIVKIPFGGYCNWCCFLYHCYLNSSK